MAPDPSARLRPASPGLPRASMRVGQSLSRFASYLVSRSISKQERPSIFEGRSVFGPAPGLRRQFGLVDPAVLEVAVPAANLVVARDDRAAVAVPALVQGDALDQPG